MATFMYRLPSWLMGGCQCELTGSDEEFEYVQLWDPSGEPFEIRVPAGTVIKTRLLPDEPPPGLYLSPKGGGNVLVNTGEDWSQLGWSNQRCSWEAALDVFCDGEVPTLLIPVPAVEAPWVRPEGAHPTSITVNPTTSLIHVTVARRDHVIRAATAREFALALLYIANKVMADS